jgi:2-hydroxy-3-oxopropionate reductase
MPEMQLGYIGLGIMGRPVTLNLLRAGYRVAVWARRPESLEPLMEAGAEPCVSPREVAERAEVIFTNLSDTADVEAVVLGPQGVIGGIRPGSILVDMSTISSSATRAMAERLRERGAEMLDAPVSGGEKGAIAGTLAIMVGGTAKAFARVRPLFEVIGANIVHCGGSGAGQVTKACNQVVIAQTLVGVAEAFVLARSAGVDPARVREALLGGFANSRVLETHGLRMLEGQFQPGFKARLHQKDMRVVLETAHELGIALPGAALVTQYVNAAVGAGLGEQDSSVIYRILERLSGLRED